MNVPQIKNDDVLLRRVDDIRKKCDPADKALGVMLHEYDRAIDFIRELLGTIDDASKYCEVCTCVGCGACRIQTENATDPLLWEWWRERKLI